MLRIGVMVSGGGTNLQAIMDAMDSGRITNTELAVVISNNANAYALERARLRGIEAVCISPREYETRDAFNEAFLAKVDGYQLDLIAGGHTRCHDREIRGTYHQYPSVPDSFFLRKGVLWAEGP